MQILILWHDFPSREQTFATLKSHAHKRSNKKHTLGKMSAQWHRGAVAPRAKRRLTTEEKNPIRWQEPNQKKLSRSTEAFQRSLAVRLATSIPHNFAPPEQAICRWCGHTRVAQAAAMEDRPAGVPLPAHSYDARSYSSRLADHSQHS